ncbi:MULTISPECIES: helix-turn-helix domain-containing protein [Paenibacillus]|uniref:Helix-turn-helix transcriptional regulator n=1 Tax=Paenibacillus peoriae TaxID=59893 RepID=A0A7H0Y313_9BACL|nr:MULTISPECIES: helix-turn-helix transcriptional regulator [Paenibacillus]QNR65471.1 helix-turn-helix transcriptional regulator [Paenibacillus peoriae]
MWYFEITLDHILVRRNISRRELARKTGIRPATINDLCNNTAKQLLFDNLAAICEELNVDVSDIIVLHKV